MKTLTATTCQELRDHRVIEISTRFKDIDIFRNIQGAVNESWLVDRCGMFKLPFHTDVLNENRLPQVRKNFNKNLFDICIERASTILENNNKIYIMWSGGIDSTVMLVSFLLTGKNLNKIIIVCNQESIKENTKFYKNNIRNNFSIISSEIFMQRYQHKKIDGIILSGEQGDLLYGQDFGLSMFKKYGKDYLTSKPSRPNLVKYFQDCNMSAEASNCWYDIFMESTKNSPRPIENIYDFSWWAGFNWRWQWSVEKVKLRSNIDQNITTFFSAEDFQQWSYCHTNKIENITDFKKEFKTVIYAYTKDIDIFQKIKIPSATLYYGVGCFAAIDQKGNRISADEFSIMDYYCKDNFIVEWLKDH